MLSLMGNVLEAKGPTIRFLKASSVRPLAHSQEIHSPSPSVRPQPSFGFRPTAVLLRQPPDPLRLKAGNQRAFAAKPPADDVFRDGLRA
jgi:hypothetical protein